jgi:hypothetical protein
MSRDAARLTHSNSWQPFTARFTNPRTCFPSLRAREEIILQFQASRRAHGKAARRDGLAHQDVKLFLSEPLDLRSPRRSP